MTQATPANTARVLAAVAACPYRGSVLSVSQQLDASCGCRGPELTECRAGRGKVPGAVTLGDCVRCQCGRIGIG